jgi:hypothetical protein
MKEVTIDIQAQAAFPDQFVSDATKDTCRVRITSRSSNTIRVV